MARPTIAIMYDFDKTLSTTDMQEYDFIKNLGITPGEFWDEATKLTNENDMDRILAYMFNMVRSCKERNIPLTKEYLNECGKSIVLYKGVKDWFVRINEYATQIGCNVEHYIISSGITEIIQGTEIAKYFKKIYGCSFLYDENGIAIWTATSINYTLKTQFIFRIQKDVLDIKDDYNLNKHAEGGKRIPFANMIYIGDGTTDVPCMKLLKENGGKAIALFPAGERNKVQTLVEDNRLNYVCVADYSEGKTLEKIVKLMMESITMVSNLKSKEQQQISSFIRASEASTNEN